MCPFREENLHPILGGRIVVSEGNRHILLDVKQNTHFTDDNQRNKFAKVSLSINDRFFEKNNHPTTQDEKEERFCQKGKDEREAIFEEEKSLRSGPKPVRPEKTPLFFFCYAGPTPVKSGSFVAGPSFEDGFNLHGAVDLSANVVEDAQDNQEEPVMGDTPPGWVRWFLVCEANSALALERDFLFSAGSFGLSEHVTFPVRRGHAGLEAVDLEARR